MRRTTGAYRPSAPELRDRPTRSCGVRHRRQSRRRRPGRDPDRRQPAQYEQHPDRRQRLQLERRLRLQRELRWWAHVVAHPAERLHPWSHAVHERSRDLVAARARDRGIVRDPAVAFGPDGTAYFACQAFSVTSPFPIALFVSRSTDGGLTWADGVHQKPIRPGEATVGRTAD